MQVAMVAVPVARRRPVAAAVTLVSTVTVTTITTTAQAAVRGAIPTTGTSKLGPFDSAAGQCDENVIR